jgi:hypothetical protein
MEGVFLKDYPPEAFTIRCLEDSMALLATEGGQQRFESILKSWMKKIQASHGHRNGPRLSAGAALRE